jgi:hypothetical protein
MDYVAVCICLVIAVFHEVICYTIVIGFLPSKYCVLEVRLSILQCRQSVVQHLLSRPMFIAM